MIKDGIIYVDNFELDTYRGCPKKYWFRIVKGKVPVRSVKTAAQFGTAVHLILEQVGKGEDPIEAINMGCKYFEPFEDLKDDKRTTGKLRDLMLTYLFEWYTNDPFKVVSKDLVEIGFAIPLTSDGSIVYTGRMDRIVRFEVDNSLWVMDHKTTYNINNFVHRPNNQFTGYYWGGREYIEGIKGVVVDLIGVYKDKPKKGVRGEWLQGKDPSTVFIRIPSTRTEEDVEIFKSEVKLLVDRIKESERLNIYPKNTLWCDSYNKRCDYIDICGMSVIEQERLLEGSGFVDDTWTAYKDI